MPFDPKSEFNRSRNARSADSMMNFWDQDFLFHHENGEIQKGYLVTTGNTENVLAPLESTPQPYMCKWWSLIGPRKLTKILQNLENFLKGLKIWF